MRSVDAARCVANDIAAVCWLVCLRRVCVCVCRAALQPPAAASRLPYTNTGLDQEARVSYAREHFGASLQASSGPAEHDHATLLQAGLQEAGHGLPKQTVSSACATCRYTALASVVCVEAC